MTPQRAAIVTARVAAVRVDVPVAVAGPVVVLVIRAAPVVPVRPARLVMRPAAVIARAVRVAVAALAAAPVVLVSVPRPACLVRPAPPAPPVVPRAIATAVVARVPVVALAVPVVARVPAVAPAVRAARVRPVAAPVVRVATTAARARPSIPTRRSIRTRP